MPSLIDYPLVLEQLQQQGFVSLYHNSGAFGFPPQTPTHSRGWIGPPDDSIQPFARPLTRPVPQPYEANLAAMAQRAWLSILPVEAWVMPKSHWAHELDFAHSDWLPPLLETIGINSRMLATLNTAAAIRFTTDESGLFLQFVQRLLEMLHGSDFAILFPTHKTLCTIHSHKQLWWTTTNPQIVTELDRIL